MWNSISQVVLKVASPGMPDFYQGNELWCFDLVDPDNRRPVDFELRRGMLQKLRRRLGSDRRGAGGAVGSRARVTGPSSFMPPARAEDCAKIIGSCSASGSYSALNGGGKPGESCAGIRAQLRRQNRDRAGRPIFSALFNGHAAPTDGVWGNTEMALPRRSGKRSFQDVFTGQIVSIEQREDGAVIPLAKAFSHCPAALLMSRPGGDYRMTKADDVWRKAAFRREAFNSLCGRPRFGSSQCVWRATYFR